MQRIIRFFVFCIFFAVGLSALGISIVCPDLVSFYSYKGLLKTSQANIDKLKVLNEDYDILLEQLEHDPNLFQRIARVTLGTEQPDNHTVSPKAKPEELTAAKTALTKKIAQATSENQLPKWLLRIKQPHRRIALFLAGSALIVISFLFFGPVSKPPKQA